ncbi:MAG TPA: NUDIX hydrolase [Patescibacteria group bacterium]|nr:NUDIX hydrolase [Patescibacteria group bacterium]
MKQIVQKIVAGGVIIKNSKVLIAQRAANEEAYPNLWEVPSGKKEPMEKIEDTVIREVYEETGLKTKIINVIDVFNFNIEKTDEIRDVTQVIFLLELNKESNVKLSTEHQNFAWVTKDELNKYNLSKETKTAIEKAFLYKKLLGN